MDGLVTLRSAAKFFLTWLVDLLAGIKRFTFPAKYPWRWKLNMLLEKYEPETTQEFKKLLKPGMTVIDIGAHIGYFTRLSSKLVGSSGRVLAFEPEPGNFSLLKYNTKDQGNVSIHNLALADKKGQMSFYISTGKTGSHSLIADKTRAEKITVRVDTLDDFLLAQGISSVDFIKMDIEGAEPLALAGMNHTLTANLQIKMVMEFCTKHLRTAGFDPMNVLRGLYTQGFVCRSIEDGVALQITPDEILAIDAKQNSYVNLLIYRA